MAAKTKDVLEVARETIAREKLASPEAPVLLMISGGSDSTALAYAASELFRAGEIGLMAMLHVNHKLRGDDADTDAAFVAQLAESLQIPLFMCEIDIARIVEQTGGNVEAVAREERYVAANEALTSLCQHAGVPLSEGRIFTAHTADDRAENFYMRSIVGTGPGGFRSMLYRNGAVCRPFLDLGREDLRSWLGDLERQRDMVADADGGLWREDATNAHTDRFRAYVRAEIVPAAKERNPQLLETLTRTMNLIADEDDMLDDMADELMLERVTWESHIEGLPPEYDAGCVISPDLGKDLPKRKPLARRMIATILQLMLGPDARIEAASVEAVLAAWGTGDAFQEKPIGGYVANIQGNLAVSANKRGVRLESMDTFRARRKRDESGKTSNEE